MAYSPDGRFRVSAGDDGAVKVRDGRTGQEITSLKEHTGPVYGVAFSRDSKQLASAGQDGAIHIREIGK